MPSACPSRSWPTPAGTGAPASSARGSCLPPCAGKTYQFPLYEPFIFGLTWMAPGALRYFRDDKGRSVVERGIDESKISRRRANGLRLLAVIGFLNLVYLLFSVASSWMAVY